jgi:hypothetical protein
MRALLIFLVTILAASLTAMACPSAPLVYYFAGAEDQLTTYDLRGGVWQVQNIEYVEHSEFTGTEEYDFSITRVGDSVNPEGIILYGKEELTPTELEKYAMEQLLP